MKKSNKKGLFKNTGDFISSIIAVTFFPIYGSLQLLLNRKKMAASQKTLIKGRIIYCLHIPCIILSCFMVGFSGFYELPLIGMISIGSLFGAIALPIFTSRIVERLCERAKILKEEEKRRKIELSRDKNKRKLHNDYSNKKVNELENQLITLRAKRREAVQIYDSQIKAKEELIKDYKNNVFEVILDALEKTQKDLEERVRNDASSQKCESFEHRRK